MQCGHFSTTCCAFKTDFQENILNKEIDWGLNIRRNRKQEKDIILAEEPSNLIITKPKQHTKKKKVKKEKVLPLCQKLSERITFNRDTATFKQYIDILSRPRPIFCPLEPEQPKKKPKINVCSPRCNELALPLKKRVLYTWQDYHDVLSPEQIVWLRDLLRKEQALLPLDAYKFFKRLQREQRKKKKLKKKKEIKKKIEKPKKSKVMREINCMARCIVKFFSEKMVQTVKCNHIILTNLMKEKLEENHLIPSGYRRDKEKDVCGRTLFETLDQLSVWLETNIGFEDEPSDEEDMSEESVSTITYSDLESVSEEEMEGEIEEREEEGEYEEFEFALTGQFMSEGEGEEEDEGKGEGMDVVIKEEPEDYIEFKIKEEPDDGGDEEWEGSDGEGKGEGAAEEGEGPEGYALEEFAGVAEELEGYAEEYMLEKPVKEPGEGSLADVADILNELIARATVSKEGLKIEEHSPDAVCCVTLKTWATWLVDVAQNTHSWCQWIQEVIARVRFFAAILKGEVKTPDGQRRILYKEEWDQFTDQLAKDIESWMQYKAHVKDLSEKIIEGFQNKRTICCSACLKSKLIISAETAHQVTEQLVEALNTTAYWRGWLDAIVDEAKKLAALEFDLPSAAGQDVSSGSYESSLVFELIELKSPSTKSSSDESVFYLEEVEDRVKMMQEQKLRELAEQEAAEKAAAEQAAAEAAAAAKAKKGKGKGKGKGKKK